MDGVGDLAVSAEDTLPVLPPFSSLEPSLSKPFGAKTWAEVRDDDGDEDEDELMSSGSTLTRCRLT